MEEETSHAVKLQLLTTAMKLFFIRPPETQKVLGALLEKCIDEELHMDVHDRALLYYRLLRTNLDEVRWPGGGSALWASSFAPHHRHHALRFPSVRLSHELIAAPVLAPVQF